MTNQEIMQLAADFISQGMDANLEICKKAEELKDAGDFNSWFNCYDFCVKNYENHFAAYDLGEALFSLNRDEEALYYFQFAANKNNYGALVRLGEFYENGIVVPKNYDIAIDYYLKAASVCWYGNQEKEVYIKIGRIYDDISLSGNIDDATAKGWHLKAIEYYEKAVEAYKIDNSDANGWLGWSKCVYAFGAAERQEGFSILKELADKDLFPMGIDLVCEAYTLGKYSAQKDIALAEKYLQVLENFAVKEEANPGHTGHEWNLNVIKESIKERKDAIEKAKNTKKNGCYVATCVYGSYDCPQVWTLRRFRDNILTENLFGRLFIKIYYAISPTTVKIFGKYKWFHNLFKRLLDKVVKKLNFQGIKDTKYSDK